MCNSSGIAARPVLLVAGLFVCGHISRAASVYLILCSPLGRATNQERWRLLAIINAMLMIKQIAAACWRTEGILQGNQGRPKTCCGKHRSEW